MGIDGVGKPSGVGPSAPVAPEGPRATGQQFSVDAEPETAAAHGAAGSNALGRLQRGEIGLDEYLEVQVQEATAHLGALPTEQLDFIRETLRAELRNDPALVELVRRTAGIVPTDLER